jgi:membrane protein CcdC involved in cytochrome C biogenesis
LPHIPYLPVLAVLASILGAVVVFIWRVREGRTAVTLRKIIIPPLGMSTGFCMFIAPICRINPLWALIAFLIGALLLAYPLILTSKLIRVGDTVMVQRHSAFFFVVIALAAVRIFARSYFDNYLTIPQTGALFFVLAFGMILRWRLSMLFDYRRIMREPATDSVEALQN